MRTRCKTGRKSGRKSGRKTGRKSGRKTGRKSGRRGGYYPETDISPQLVNQQSYPVGSLLNV